VELVGPDTPEFHEALKSLLGGDPDEVLRLATRYAVIVRNAAQQAIALLGIRFDMVGEKGNAYSVVHYSDTLRNPEKADLTPGATRFVCAEPLYTALVLRRKVSQREADRRARMNLSNLAKAREIRASIDCVAFDDGTFVGRDSLRAFERLRGEREVEIAFLNEILQAGTEVEVLLASAIRQSVPARRALAKHLQEGLQTGGRAEAIARARSYRPRIELSR
jgi:hypothetical protein